MDPSRHTAVLVEEAMRILDVKPGGKYLDATLGGGTHTMELLRLSAPDGLVVSLDVDPAALERMRDLLKDESGRWIGVEANFRGLEHIARDTGVAPLDGILLDLGLSSDELADRTKGLSFMENGPLDMRLGPTANEDGLTAAEIVNSWTREDIERVIDTFGEEKFAHRIARAIVEARKAARIIGTLDLAAIVKQAVPQSYERGRIHPATRTFQALRMVVNDELASLKLAIAGAEQALKPGGRIAIISFHSLEDRIVKQAFQASDTLTNLTKKPITPGEQELEKNPRSRSAKLRAAEKTQVTS